MGDLVLYSGILVIGYLLGKRGRKSRASFRWTGKAQTAALIILVLLMGMRMGANEEVTSNVATIGLTALIMTVVIVGFSVGAVAVTRIIMGMDRYGHVKSGRSGSKSKKPEISDMPGRVSEKAAEPVGALDSAQGADSEVKSGSGRLTLIIIVFVAIGIAVGYFIVPMIFGRNSSEFENLMSIGIKVGLCVLILFIGIDFGMEGTIIGEIRQAGLKVLAFPAAVIAGSLLGAGVCSLFMSFSLKECLAIGAGCGWYTFAPGVIMDNGYVAAGAVSFMHNVMRELSAIIFIPVVARRIGYIESTAMPGASAADICLPIVEKATRPDIAIYSIVSGIVVSISVPILVPLIIQ